MSCNWPKVRLGDITEWFSGGTPPVGQIDCWNGDIPWISASSMDGIRYDRSDRTITSIGLRKSRLAKKGTILLLVRGSILHQRIPVGMATKDVAFNQDVKAISVKNGVNPKYILYWLIGHETMLLEMVSFTGIGAGKLDTLQLQNLEVELPSEQIQTQVVDIIENYDDKIALNTQINQTLESMAQALFQSWFVDFDPVKAKLEVRAQGGSDDEVRRAAMAVICPHPQNGVMESPLTGDLGAMLAETADLFPEVLVESELGLIPEGWGVKSLDEIANYQNGLALQKFRPEEGEEGLPVLKIAQLSKGFADGEERATAKIKPECIVQNGDVVFSWSGSLMVDIWCGGTVALNQHLFKVTSKSYPKWYYLSYTKHHLAEFQRIASAKAVTMGHIKREHLSQALCSVPPKKIFDIAEQSIGSIISKQIVSRLENEILTVKRDILLPKLLSGEIDLNQFERNLK